MPADTTERALSLLSLLSSRPSWTGPELTARLGVTDRTVRRDIERLRTLGYRVDSTGGTGGGYRFRAGANIPPLFLDEDETIAVVAALLVAVGNQTTGMVDGSTRALGKLHHLLPAPLMRKVAALRQSALAVPSASSPQIDPKVVGALAEACRNRIAVRFDYRSRADVDTSRRVEPASIVTVRGVWYVIGFDLDRDDWRVFRVDRMGDVVSTGHDSADRVVPGNDPLAFLGRSLASATYEHTAQLTVDGTPAELTAAAPWLNTERITTPRGDVTDVADGGVIVRLGSDSVDDLVGQIVRIAGATRVTAVMASDAAGAHLARLGAVFRAVGPSRRSRAITSPR